MCQRRHTLELSETDTFGALRAYELLYGLATPNWLSVDSRKGEAEKRSKISPF